MRVKVVAVGNRMPTWVIEGVEEYQKRLPREWRFTWVELPLGPRAKSQSTNKAVQAESKSMLNAINVQSHVVALDVKGKSWGTQQLAKQLSAWQMQGRDLELLIGGPDGLSPECLQTANESWSLSPLTLPHPLVRIILIEQLYRAWSLLNNHPYHK